MQRWPRALDASSSADKHGGAPTVANGSARDQPDAALLGQDSRLKQSSAVEPTLARHSAAGSFEDQGAVSTVQDASSSGLGPLQVVPDEEIARLFAE